MSNYKVMEVVQGDSSKTLTAVADGVLTTDWTGKIVVRETLGSASVNLIEVAMTLDIANNRLYATLSPADTLSLTEGTSYFLTVEIENLVSSPAYRKEIKKYHLNITSQGA